MGVKFYEYLKSHKLVKKYQPGSREYDNLFVDGTNIFGFFKDSPRKPFYEFIDVIYILLPKQLVYVSMDGESPNPKHQRQKEQGKEQYIPDREKLTPEELNSIEGSRVREYASIGYEFGVPIHYNGRNNAGEAEHKIIQYIREQKKGSDWKTKQKHFVLSNDNDVLFLLLPFIDEDISIIKLDKNNRTQRLEFYEIEVQQVRSHFLNQFPAQYRSKFNYSDEKVMNDFVALSFFLGNDYIGQFEEIEQVRNSFEKIIVTYISLNSSGSRYIYITYNGAFDKQIFQRFILALSTKFSGAQRQKQPQINFNGKRSRTKNQQQQRQQQTRYNDTEKIAQVKDLLAALKWTYTYYIFGQQSSNYKLPNLEKLSLQDFGKLIEYC